MLAMMQRDILVLPVHDSFIVRAGYFGLLRDEMKRAHTERMQNEISIKMDLSFLETRPKSPNLDCGDTEAMNNRGLLESWTYQP